VFVSTFIASFIGLPIASSGLLMECLNVTTKLHSFMVIKDSLAVAIAVMQAKRHNPFQLEVQAYQTEEQQNLEVSLKGMDH